MAKNTVGASASAKSQTPKNNAISILMFVFFLVLGILVVIPFYANFISSFKPGRDIVQYGLNVGIDLKRMSFDNYVYLFTGEHYYFRWFFNSMGLTIVQVTCVLMVCAFVAYGFACYRFKGRNVFFTLVLLTMMVPFEILMLPLYTEIINLHLADTWAGIILPGVTSASTIFFFRQYLLSIPKEIIDAGRVDGCSEYGIYFRLIMPIMKPSFAAMAILNGMNSWNNFLWPLLVFRTDKNFTLPIGLRSLLTPYGNNYDLLIVGSFFSVIPLFILFLAFQRYFLDGMTAGAVKG